MSNTAKQYILDHLDLIDANEWDIFFNNAPDGVGELLYAADIDFLSYLNAVPRGCFVRSDIIDIILPKTITRIKDYAFYKCSSLISVTIPDNVTSIGTSAFSECSSLTDVYITDLSAWCGISFSNFFDNPLYYAKNLYLNGKLVTDLVIPDGVTSIGNYAFSDCDGLTSVTIPDSVTSIGYYAFSDCGDVEISFSGTKEEWNNIYSAEAFRRTNFTCHCIDGDIVKKR